MSLIRWLRICLLNLLLVASLGILLRYKIAFALPFVDQKQVLESHYHFAFTGWVSQTLLVLMVNYLQNQGMQAAFKKYKGILLLNLISAYGMLIGFILQGYGLLSISFLLLSTITTYAFAYRYWKDLNNTRTNLISNYWFKAALLFNVLSSLGAFSLTLMLVLKIINQKLYLFSSYFFLHFQYNGWFFFACMGLFFHAAKFPHLKTKKTIFWLFAIATVPAYFLSALWATIHSLLFWMVVLAAIGQMAGWVLFIKLLSENLVILKSTFAKNSRWILLTSAIACSIKITLQLFSVFPFLSKLAFSFRPIVIGYLHLVLLGVITLFLIGYIVCSEMVKTNKVTFIGLGFFVVGIFLNEMMLMTQGVSAIFSIMVPYINELLLAAALVMFCGLLLANLSLKKT